MDRLAAWDPEGLTTCLLCGSSDESRDHLFFQCSYSLVIWRLILQRVLITTIPTGWSVILQWLLIAHPDSLHRLALLQAWQAAIYEIWCERNRRFHDGLTLVPSRVWRMIISALRDKCSSMVAKDYARGPALAQFWFDPPENQIHFSFLPLAYLSVF